MRPRALPVLLLLAAAPDFDPDLAALSWTTRPRREIVDALAARLLRGEAKGWTELAKEMPPLPAPPSRIPEDFEVGKLEVADPLAARVPADTAVALFESLKAAEDAVEGLSEFLPEALPDLCDDPPGGKRDALRRGIEMLLLPTIWRSNPGVRTGTRQIAVVAADPDLRWAPDIALVAEVDDASLVLFHRRSTLSWEDRGRRRLRVDGLDAVSDDGSVRSFFTLEGGVAIWATTRSLRDRVLAAAAGKAPTLLSPDPRAYALARRTFPAKEGGALLVVPDAFLDRVNAAESRARRAAALRCEAARLLLDARTSAGAKGAAAWKCPAGGTLMPARGEGSTCSVHGSNSCPTPAGDLPAAGRTSADAVDPRDDFARGLIPVAARWKSTPLEILAIDGKSPGPPPILDRSSPGPAAEGLRFVQVR